MHVGALPTINADQLQMRQLIQNLVSNALKFRREGIAPQVDIDAVVADGNMVLTVRDNGIGFDPRYSLRIFRAFERLHGRTEYSEAPGSGWPCAARSRNAMAGRSSPMAWWTSDPPSR